MLKTRIGIFSVVSGVLLGVSAAHAQTIIQPPFGLRWGDTPEKLISWSSKHSLDLNIFLPGDQQGLRVISVKAKTGNLPGSLSSSVEGKFLNGGLYEMTVHYSDPRATPIVMEQRFEKLRTTLTSEYGAFLPNQQQKSVEDGFVTLTRSFHKEPIRGLLLLIAWTEVEDRLRKAREARFSLIYRNDNFKEELRKRAGGR